MRVLLVTGEYPPAVGGVGDHTRGLARALLASGVEVAVLTGVIREQQEEESSPPAGEPRVLRAVQPWDWRALRRVRQAVDGFQPDIVHFQYQAAAYGMHLAANLLPAWLRWRRPKAPVVTTFHDLREPYLFPKAGRLRSWAMRAMASSSRGVITTNPEDRERLEAVLGDGSTRVLGLIPLAVDSIPERQPDRASVREVWGIPGDCFLVGHFGLLNPTKGVDTLLRAVRLLRDWGIECELAMIGDEEGASDPTNRAYAQRMRDLADELGVAEHVHGTGFLEPKGVWGALRALDCCVLPFADGASYRRSSLLTALAAGVPMVTTHPRYAQSAPIFGGGWLPSLQDGEQCLLVPPNEPEALAMAIRQLRDGADLRGRLGEGGRAATSGLTWEELSRRTRELYREVLGEGGRSTPCEP